MIWLIAVAIAFAVGLIWAACIIAGAADDLRGER